jgi:hypothetical protein
MMERPAFLMVTSESLSELKTASNSFSFFLLKAIMISASSSWFMKSKTLFLRNSYESLVLTRIKCCTMVFKHSLMMPIAS